MFLDNLYRLHFFNVITLKVTFHHSFFLEKINEDVAYFVFCQKSRFESSDVIFLKRTYYRPAFAEGERAYLSPEELDQHAHIKDILDRAWTTVDH